MGKPGQALRVSTPRNLECNDPQGYSTPVLHAGYMGSGGERLGARFASEKTPLAVMREKNTHLRIDLGAGALAQ